MHSFKSYSSLKEEIDNKTMDDTPWLSSIDHDLTRMTALGRLNYVQSTEDSDLSKLSKSSALYVAAIIEKIYNDCGLTPPDFVMNSKYTYDNVEESKVYKQLYLLFLSSGDFDKLEFEKMVKSTLAVSVKEFKWRNELCDGIFDSF